MDSERNKKPRSATQSVKGKDRGEHSGVKAKKSRTFQKSNHAKKSAISGDLKKNAQINLYKPIKEQLKILLRYIEVMEFKHNIDLRTEVFALIEMIEHMKKHFDVYLNYELLKLGKKNG